MPPQPQDSARSGRSDKSLRAKAHTAAPAAAGIALTFLVPGASVIAAGLMHTADPTG
ncbi:hypothetical protein BX265_7519 [Streptomyces sp. TLI_235]|nr:hypothetical protein BX265_7519 [Streptomyces sp. TLI_235]